MSKLLSRRNLLRGAGVAMSLPWLESIARGAPVAAVEKLPEPPLRMACLFMPNGVRPDYWTPAGDGEDYEFTPHLKPLESLKSEFLLIENLWNKNTVGRNGHWPKVPAWLSGGFVERTTGGDLDSGGTTVDQFVAQRLGTSTALPSFELGIDAPRTGIDTAGGGFPRALGSFLSWADPKTPVPKEIVPQLAFDRLFRNRRAPVVSGIDPKSPAMLASLQRDDTSLLDTVLEQAKALRGKGSRNDQTRLDEYFDSVRSVERRLEASMRPQKRWINEGKFSLDRPVAGTPATHAEHVRLMLDILLLAFWTDNTRIATFMFGDAQSSQDYSFLPGVQGNFHGISHHRDIVSQREQYEKIINWHTEQLAYFLTRMRSLDEGGTSLLDNSMILFGGSLKDGNRHIEENLPILLAGRGKGTLRPGRRLRAAQKTPFCNLHLAMMHRMGVREETFGDSTGVLEGLS
ncbi:MAG TPA: DUF1552 domain-containing protein [Bryobacteraceae bacterium]|nr:DUF1552 domain-containing protein [Bryobacteraceae bacterium]